MRRHLMALLFCGAMSAVAAPQETVSIAFVGDLMLAETPGQRIRKGEDPVAPFAPLLDRADIRIANLECVIASNGRAIPGKPYAFRAAPRTLKVVQRHFDAVSLANNHSGDFGPAAFAQMLSRLEGAGVAYFGGGRDLRAAHAPLIVERHGLRIAFLGYNEFAPRSFEAGEDWPGIAWSEDEQVRHDIEQARTRHRADLVIPFMHWGWENETVSNARQRHLARLMIDAGADAVVGSHPHVTQETASYRGRPIIYSLGNFVFDGFSSPENNTAWVLRLEANRQGIQRWRIAVGRIDRHGTPHPLKRDPGLCWEAGMEAGAPCRN